MEYPERAPVPDHPLGEWIETPSITNLSVPAGSFELFSNFNGTIKDDFSEFDNLRTSKKTGR
jgi:hypothetical protein